MSSCTTDSTSLRAIPLTRTSPKRVRPRPAHRIAKSVLVAVRELGDMLGEHVSPRQPMSFMNAEVEGFGPHVLRSNEWLNCRSFQVQAEALSASLAKIAEQPRTRYLRRLGCGPVAKTVAMSFYRGTGGAR